MFGLVDAYVGEGKSCESEVATAGVLLNIQLFFSLANKILSYSCSVSAQENFLKIIIKKFKLYKI